jgi:hypothetical protein
VSCASHKRQGATGYSSFRSSSRRMSASLSKATAGSQGDPRQELAEFASRSAGARDVSGSSMEGGFGLAGKPVLEWLHWIVQPVAFAENTRQILWFGKA